METKEIKTPENVDVTNEQSTNQPDEQQVINAIEHVDPNVLLRNLAFWLDVAIAKGRFIDMLMQSKNAVPSPDKDKE